MNATETNAWANGLAGVWSGDGRLAARVGDGLAALPGRWRWGIERLLGWWLSELSALFRSGGHNRDARGIAVIGEADLLQFSFAVPPEALGLVRERIALMIEERTPFTIDEVLAAYRLENDGPDVRVVVRLAPLSHLAVALPEEGVEAVALAGGSGQPMIVPVPAALLEPSLRRARAGAARRRTAVAAAILLALATALLVPLWARREALAREQAAMEEQRAVLAPLVRRTALARSAERAAAEAWRLKAAAPAPLPVLDHLTARIGEDSYLTEFRLAEGDGVIGGFTTQASALPGPLEADPLLSKVRLTGPVSRDGQDGRQRFEIAFRVSR